MMTLLYFPLLPFLLLLSLKEKYHLSIPARFLLWKNPTLPQDGVWFHVCSFGEANAIEGLLSSLPKEAIRVTTTTQTGAMVASKHSTFWAYLPFEPLLFFWMKPQKALVVMEAEFWYLLFALAKAKGAKTLLINARISERSFPKYQRFGWLYRQIFAQIDEVYAQTTQDAQRLEALGAKEVRVIGNIKLASLPQPKEKFRKPSGLLVCAGSTHEGEEELIVEAFLALKAIRQDARLVVAPRHPERFEAIGVLLERVANKEGLSYHRYSKQADFHSDIVLLDTLGVLVSLYAISDIVILGGAFVPLGGHNAAEPAQFGCKIISGKHYFNQVDIFQAIEGIVIVEDFHLKKRLLEYGRMKKSRLKYRSSTKLIEESLADVL